MDDNAQRRAEELEALHMIFDEDPTTSLQQPDASTLVAVLNIQLPYSLRLQPLPSETTSSGSSDHSDSDNDANDANDDAVVLSEGCFVRLVATCFLPSGYPSAAPPRVQLQPAWLAACAAQIDEDEQQQSVATLWEACPGEPVLFQWLSMLRERFTAADDHVAAATHPVDWDHNEMYAYARQVRDATRRLRHVLPQSCPVCLEEVAASTVVELLNCDHFICRECLLHFCDINLRDGAVLSLRCPIVGCNELLHPENVHSVVTEPGAYERYERLLLEKTLASIPEVAYCPRTHCSAIATADRAAKMGRCTKCHVTFCLMCNGAWHPGDCDSFVQTEEEDPTLQARKRDKTARAKREKERAEWQHQQELMKIAANTVATPMKRCPNCYVVIEKNGGCDHMYCVSCRTAFNWSTAPTVGAIQKLRKQDFELLSRPKPKRDKTEASKLDNLTSCPTCRAGAEKIDNLNHMECIACATKFCFLCSRVVRKTNLHFFPAGPCPQHSDDKRPLRFSRLSVGQSEPATESPSQASAASRSQASANAT